MSFRSIALAVEDEPLQRRITAAYARENNPDPATAAWQRRWQVAADPSVADPYAFAINAGTPNPGDDETVVTDPMLTAAVQAHPYP